MTEITRTLPQRLLALAVLAALFAAPFTSFAASLTVDPLYAGITTNNIVAVPGDSAPGFGSGSFASDGSGKTDIYFSPADLFGRDVTLGEIASMSYWTKKGDLHTVNPADWYIAIYTKPYAGDISGPGWYGDRIGTEPYFANNLTETAGAWTEWTTDGAVNKLRFFESTQGYFGSYTDPDWDTFVAGDALSGLPYASRELLYVTLQTGSGWANGFTGQLDGLTITLTDGTVASVNFEDVPPPQPEVKEDCFDGSWESYGFKNQGQCVRFVETGKDSRL